MRRALLWLAATLAATGAWAGDARAAGDDDDKPAADKPAEESAIFELVAKDAEPVGDVSLMLGALTDRCPDEKRVLDRARCQATLAYLRRTLPDRTFSFVARDPAAIAVSPYDKTFKGYRITLNACVACTSPIRIGRSTDPVYVT